MSNESFFAHSVTYTFSREDARIERLVVGAAREMAVTYGPVKFHIEQLSVSVSSTPAILDRFSETFSRRCKSLGLEFSR